MSDITVPYAFSIGTADNTTTEQAAERIVLKSYGIDKYTKLLIHANGPNGSTTFVDSSFYNHALTAVGGAQISTAQSVFGGSSALFNGSSGCYVSTPDSEDWYIPADFTIDFWARFNSLSLYAFVGTSQGSSFRPKWMLYYDHTNSRLTFHFVTTNGNSQYLNWNWSPSANTWYHIALVKSGTTFYCFVNGVSLGTNTSTLPLPNVASDLRVGACGEDWIGFNGFIDEFRLSKDIARWTEDFTPPNQEYSGYPTQAIITPPSNTTFENGATIKLGTATTWIFKDGEAQAEDVNYAEFRYVLNGTSSSWVTLSGLKAFGDITVSSGGTFRIEGRLNSDSTYRSGTDVYIVVDVVLPSGSGGSKRSIFAQPLGVKGGII